MKRTFFLLLLLLAACSAKPNAQAPFPTQLIVKATEAPIPTLTKTPLQYPYPASGPVMQATAYSYPAPVVIITPTQAPTRTPSQTLIPTPTVIQPSATFPPSLNSLKIALISENKLFTWYQGKTSLLAEIEEHTYLVKISSDGTVIALLAPSGLWVINFDGSGRRLLVGKDQFQVVNPYVPERKSLLNAFKWIPNTHRLLFNTQVDTQGECCYTTNDDLYMVDADTLKIQTLLPPGKAGGYFIISPDGKRVALVYANGVNMLNLNTREKYNLIKYEPVAFGSEVGGYLSPIWSNDSQYLVLVIPPPDIYYGTEQSSKIWKLFVNHLPPKLVSTIGPAFGYPVLSPDFLKIANGRLEGSSQVMEIHIANVDGSEDEIYETGAFSFRGWAPDSTHFLFADFNEKAYIGQKGTNPAEFDFPAYNLRWLDNQTFIYQTGHEIRLGFLDGSSRLLISATTITNYDFAR